MSSCSFAHLYSVRVLNSFVCFGFELALKVFSLGAWVAVLCLFVLGSGPFWLVFCLVVLCGKIRISDRGMCTSSLRLLWVVVGLPPTFFLYSFYRGGKLSLY